MAKIEILLPAMGEGIIEATITKWLVNVGDKVEEDQSIVEVATDKVDSEIPSPHDGIIEKIFLMKMIFQSWRYNCNNKHKWFRYIAK